MPKGISEDFLALLERELPRAWRALALASVLAVLGLGLADLADEPRLGEDALRFLAALGVGLVVGVTWARVAAVRLLHRLKDRWTHTMRDAAGATSLVDLDRRLRGLGPTPSWRAPAIAVAVTVANVALFVLLWAEAAAAPWASMAVLTGDGLAAGAWAGACAYRLVFVRTFVREVDGLVSRGAVGVWGEA